MESVTKSKTKIHVFQLTRLKLLLNLATATATEIKQPTKNMDAALAIASLTQQLLSTSAMHQPISTAGCAEEDAAAADGSDQLLS